MKTRLYSLTSQQFSGPERPGPYTVDGQPGTLPPDIVELEVIREPYPTNLARNQRAKPLETLSLSALTVTYGWEIEEFVPPPYRVSRDTIWNRVKAAIGPDSAAAIIAAMTDAQRYDWFGNSWFWSHNEAVRGFISAIGLDPDAIMSRDDQGMML